MPVIYNHTSVVGQSIVFCKEVGKNRHLIPATGAFSANINTLTKVSRARKEYSPLVVRGRILRAFNQFGRIGFRILNLR